MPEDIPLPAPGTNLPGTPDNAPPPDPGASDLGLDAQGNLWVDSFDLSAPEDAGQDAIDVVDWLSADEILQLLAPSGTGAAPAADDIHPAVLLTLFDPQEHDIAAQMAAQDPPPIDESTLVNVDGVAVDPATGAFSVDYFQPPYDDGPG